MLYDFFYLFLYIIEVINFNYIPLNGHFINGFIAGDGCLTLSLKDKNFYIM